MGNCSASAMQQWIDQSAITVFEDRLGVKYRGQYCSFRAEGFCLAVYQNPPLALTQSGLYHRQLYHQGINSSKLWKRFISWKSIQLIKVQDAIVSIYGNKICPEIRIEFQSRSDWRLVWFLCEIEKRQMKVISQCDLAKLVGRVQLDQIRSSFRILDKEFPEFYANPRYLDFRNPFSMMSDLNDKTLMKVIRLLRQEIQFILETSKVQLEEENSFETSSKIKCNILTYFEKMKILETESFSIKCKDYLKGIFDLKATLPCFQKFSYL